MLRRSSSVLRAIFVGGTIVALLLTLAVFYTLPSTLRNKDPSRLRPHSAEEGGKLKKKVVVVDDIDDIQRTSNRTLSAQPPMPPLAIAEPWPRPKEEPSVVYREHGDVVLARKGNASWTLNDMRRLRRAPPPRHPPHPSDYPQLSTSPSAVFVPSSLNRSTSSPRLIYNRVPKCASSTMQSVLASLFKQNHFDYVASAIYWVKAFSKREERGLMNKFFAHPAPYVMDRHFYFVDVETMYRVGGDDDEDDDDDGGDSKAPPNWVNVIRDPIERVISTFYYLRQAKRWPTAEEKRPPESWFAKDFSSCVLDPHDLECQFDPSPSSSPTLLVEQQLTYFCGSAPECRQVGHRGALQQAKRNLETHFAVVGLADDLQMTLRVMEGYLPRFFRGALDVYRRLAGDRQQEYRRNSGGLRYDDLLSDEARIVLERNMSMELDFFRFATQRLLLQDRKLQLTDDFKEAERLAAERERQRQAEARAAEAAAEAEAKERK